MAAIATAAPRISGPTSKKLLKRSQDKLKQAMPGGPGGLSGSIVFAGVVIFAAIAAFFAFTFRVDPDELGVVMRFGKPIRQEPPGLHFRMPYPIDEVRLPKVTRQNIIEIGMRTGADGARRLRRRDERARREPDADRRREHRRRQFRRLLAHPGRARNISSTSRTPRPP